MWRFTNKYNTIYTANAIESEAPTARYPSAQGKQSAALGRRKKGTLP